MTYSSDVLALSPLLYWRLGEASGTTAADASGNGRNGAYAGSPTLGVAGAISGDSNTAVDFDGSNDKVTYSDSTNLTAYTVIAWFKKDASGGFEQDLASRLTSSTSGRLFVLSVTNGRVWASGFNNTGTSTDLNSGVVVTDSQWHMAAMTYDGTTLRVYVDGVLKSSGALSGTLATGSIPFHVGDNAWYSAPFDGSIDEVAYWSTALTGTNISNLYAAATVPPSNDLNFAATMPPVVGSGSLVTSRSMQANAQLSPVVGAVQIIATSRSVNLAGAVGPVIGSFNVDNSAAAEAFVSGIIPSVVGSVSLQSQTAEPQANRSASWKRDNYGEAVWSPPVVVPAILPMQQVAAKSYSAPVVSGTEALVDATYTREPAYRDRILIAGRDVTYFRGAPTPRPEYDLLQPFLWGAATIELPQVVLPFEQPGHGDLAWLKPGAPVLIQRVDNDTNEVVKTDYRGLVVAFDTSGALRVECGGWLIGKASLQDRQMRLIQTRRDAGGLVASALRRIRGVVHQPILGTSTGIQLIDWGGGGLLDYLNELVAKMTTTSGDKWTVMPDDDGIFHTTLLDTEAIHGTVYFDDARVKFDGRRDMAEEPNRIYASGVTPDGMVVKFGAYPGLIQGPAAPYPMNDNSAFGIGTTDGDTDTGDGISIMGIRLRVTGYLDARDFYSTYDADMAEGIKALQRDAELAVTGTMNLNTWRALWTLSETGYDLRGIEILPAAEDTAVKPFRRSSTGAIIARNPNYDPTVDPVDRTIAMGAGFTKAQIRQWARRELTGGEVWRGTIEITTGAIVAGDHTPGDPVTTLLRSRDIKPGMNLSAPLFAGGTVFHVAGVSVQDDERASAEGKVTLVVSTVPDDTMPAWAAIQRDRENRNTVHRSFNQQRRASSFDRENTYDEVGGTISPVRLEADNWTVFPVVAKQAGTIEKIHLDVTPDREFVVAAFGRKVSEARLRRVTNAPLTQAGRERWTEEAVYDALNRDHVVLYVAGSDEDPCGYFPRRKSEDGSLTGRWEDDAGFPFVTYTNATDRGSVIWVAVWVGAAATLRGGRIMWPSAEEY